ncbi:MAG: sterol-binding protein [Gammaproteobacteria bacterium]|nr:sterol-binding protein [Gammaproteobacteria bacterium]
MNNSDFLAFSIESALNAYLGLDPDVVAVMKEIDGRLIEFKIVGADISLFFIPLDGRVLVSSESDDKPDAIVSGSLLTLTRVGLSGNSSKVLSGTEIEFSGDLDVGRTFYEALLSVDIEWEELLAGRIGDVAAHQFGNVVRDIRAWIGRSRDSLRMDLSEYLQEESKIVPTPVEIEVFMDGVDTLRSDVDRLQARVDRMTVNSVEGLPAEPARDQHGK